MNSLPTGAHGIPNGWTKEDGWPQEYYEYFTIHTLNEGEISLPIMRTDINGREYYTEYSLNNGEWYKVTDIDNNVSNKLSVKKGDEIRIRNVGNHFHCCEFGGYEDDEGRGDSWYPSFECNCKYEVYGNIMSLLYGDNFVGKNDLTEKSDHTFAYLFFNESNLVSANRLILPATTLENYCYQGIFCGCTGLRYVPPILIATTLKNYCYQDMFEGCTALMKAPELPATTLPPGCYEYMFLDCENLKYIKMLGVSVPNSSSLYNWVKGVASSGTFVRNASMTSLSTGINGIPSGWTVETQTV